LVRLVEADQERAVHVTRGQIVTGPAFVARGLRHHQDELLVARREGGADAAQQPWKERVREDLAGRLGDDDRDRVAAAGDQASSRPVGGVAELIDDRADPDADVRADSRRVVHDAGDGGPRHAGETRDLFQGRVAVAGAAGGLDHVDSLS
jgi:hypothetical protein